MLVLPELDVVTPRTEAEVASALAGPPGAAVVIAGGTDLVPNLKRGLFAPRRLVSLRLVPTLRCVRVEGDGSLAIGATATLTEVAASPLVRARHPALAHAASLVASPQIRGVGTIGGNLCLDTRCCFYNQTAFWRRALGNCIKRDGGACHVVPTGQRCVAANAADTPAPLLAYGARVRLLSTRGVRELPVAELYRSDGAAHLRREPDELVTAVVLPAPERGTRGAYRKLALRKAIDFPLLSIAVVTIGEGERATREIRAVVSALGAKPRVVAGVTDAARGGPIDDAVVEAVAAAARAQSHPLGSVQVDAAWRRDMVAEEVRRAFRELAASVDPP